ncbi:MAG TPA: Gmad2 immunoglobulin-like domain-containing protein [Anaerolineales bacterium]|nr:Gmad2 immunoglobulin-like domain-containing protein [Anaerolineales bacterium]
MRPIKYTILGLAAAVIACGVFSPSRGTNSALPIGTSAPSTERAATGNEATTPPETGGLPEEAILILTPGNGSRLVGRVHVEGVADSTFEQTLALQLVAFYEGVERVLAEQPVLIQAELGQRGLFAADVVFTNEAATEQPGEVRVIAVSPRDGGRTHLATAQVTLAASGPEDIRAAEPHAELILITAPAPAGTISGGVAHVEGIGLASFEQTLVVEVYDADGQLLGRASTIVSAPDYGVHGPFTADVSYSVSSAGPGRIVVLDPSPAFGQTLHLASVEIRIEP